MKHENIETPEVLNRWAQEVDRKFEMLDDAYSKFNINTGNWKNEATEDAVNYKFGKFLGALQHGDKQQIGDMGGQLTRWQNSDRDIKTVVGSPLTGDASSTDAQYLVPQIMYEDTVLRFANTTSALIPAVRRMQMSGRLHRFAVENTEPTFVFVTNEITSKTEKLPDWTNKDLEAETFAYYVSASDELVEDTFLDLGNLLRQQAVQAYVTCMEDQIVTATSPFTGILQNTGTVDRVMSGVTFESVEWSDLLNMIKDLSTFRKSTGASFLMHRTVWAELISKQNAVGSYWYNPTVGPSAFSVWGYPVILSDSCPALSETATETAFIAYGNFRVCHVLGIRMGMEVKYFPDTIQGAVDDQVFFRFRTRFGSVTGLPTGIVRLLTAAS